jgi:hypothetical protein
MIIEDHKTISIVGSDLKNRMQAFRHKLGVMKAGYPDLINWNGTEPKDWDYFSSIPAKISKVYRGNEKYAYCCHQSICKFKDRYVAAWSNGYRHEDHGGQQVHYSWSNDGICWEKEKAIAPCGVDTVQTNSGLFADGDTLYAFMGVCGATEKIGGANLRYLDMTTVRLDVYETKDLVNWKRHERIAEKIYVLEAPRYTAEGDLICCGFDIEAWFRGRRRGLVLLWEKGMKLTDAPIMVEMPSSRYGVISESASWYQRDDGRIWMYLRDGAYSLRLALSFSDDGGRTWTEPVRTDFPNTYSKHYAGRLKDGRYFICGNNYDHYLDRSHMMIAISDDGETFNKMHTILNRPTTRRIDGYHKENGYHYPSCLVDGDKLLLICAENKEDILVAVIETKGL